MKRVDQRRCPHDEMHLVFIHAGLEPGQHFAIDDTALLNIDPVNSGQLEGAFMGARHEEERN